MSSLSKTHVQSLAPLGVTLGWTPSPEDHLLSFAGSDPWANQYCQMCPLL